jgi:hypothetical protein
MFIVGVALLDGVVAMLDVNADAVGQLLCGNAWVALCGAKCSGLVLSLGIKPSIYPCLMKQSMKHENNYGGMAR